MSKWLYKYSIMSSDRGGISLRDETLEQCKRYCFNSDIIVKSGWVPRGLEISIFYSWRLFRFHFKYRKGCCIPKLEFNLEVLGLCLKASEKLVYVYGEEVYRNNKTYTETMDEWENENEK